MSNENISVGDLVVVYKPRQCCGSDDAIGRHFVVRDIKHVGLFCRVCKAYFSGIGAVVDEGIGDISRLKKIQPLSELTSTEIKEEIPA